MSLSADTALEISAFVRAGFEERERIIEVFCEELYEPGELDPAEVADAVDAEWAVLLEEEKSWPAVTDCDKLDAAFLALNRRGIVALQNAGYTQSDGYDDVRDAFNAHPTKAEVSGYCFYHGQDLERAVLDQGLYLAFGPMDAKKEEAEGPLVGRAIVEELNCAGLQVDWDGTFSQRIRIPVLDWKRGRSGKSRRSRRER